MHLNKINRLLSQKCQNPGFSHSLALHRTFDSAGELVRWTAIEPVHHSEIPQPHDILSHAINRQIKHDVDLL
jgi:hypothetical protein